MDINKNKYGKFFRDTKEVRGPRSYDWLKGGYLGKTTDSYKYVMPKKIYLKLEDARHMFMVRMLIQSVASVGCGMRM